MNRYVDKKKINFLTVFLLLDLIAVFSIFKTSNATYTSDALGTAEMEVALYAFKYGGMNEIDGVDGGTVLENIDVNLGDISPGETKYYKFNIYNYLKDEETNIDKVSETSISYKLKVITTTNLPLDYRLYYNESPFSNSSTNLLSSDSSNTNDIITDGYGTYYKVFPVEEKCFKLNTSELKSDQYTLVVHFPSMYSDVLYQDLIESIKIQIESKQVLPGDIVLEKNVCR